MTWMEVGPFIQLNHCRQFSCCRFTFTSSAVAERSLRQPLRMVTSHKLPRTPYDFTFCVISTTRCMDMFFLCFHWVWFGVLFVGPVQSSVVVDSAAASVGVLHFYGWLKDMW